MVMLLCTLLTANLMLRYFRPVVSFTVAISLFFVDAVTTIPVLSYNTIPPLLLVLVA
jgi:hypothetical protein